MSKAHTIKSTRHNPTRRKERGLLAVGINLPKIAAPAIRKRGFTQARLVTDWPVVVGNELAKEIAPRKLVFPRGAQTGAILHLSVSPGFAVELQHIAPQVIDRINVFFGYRAIQDLRYFQTPISRMKSRRRVPVHALSSAEEARLKNDLEQIQDVDLKNSFAKLGRAIRSKSPQEKESA